MNLRGIFDLNSKKDELKNLEEKLNEDNFWQDVDNANVINKKISHLKKEINLYEELDKELNESIEIVSSEDDELINLISDNIKLLEEKINELEIATLLNGEFDEYNCFLEIHPGAGGTESCDWTSMLFRMYEKFCEKEGFSWETIDEAKGDEAGLKSVMIKITGDFAFGYLKFESGVHRLVRISPFDSGARRHTSFASVTVFPEIKKNISIEIKEEDLKIDTTLERHPPPYPYLTVLYLLYERGLGYGT